MATFIAWLLPWIIGLLFPVIAPWLIRRLSGQSLGGRPRRLPGARLRTKGPSASAEAVMPTCDTAPVLGSYGAVQRQEGTVIPNLYYFAAWTDSGCLLGCDHHHRTVISAAN